MALNVFGQICPVSVPLCVKSFDLEDSFWCACTGMSQEYLGQVCVSRSSGQGHRQKKSYACNYIASRVVHFWLKGNFVLCLHMQKNILCPFRFQTNVLQIGSLFAARSRRPMVVTYPHGGGEIITREHVSDTCTMHWEIYLHFGCVPGGCPDLRLMVVKTSTWRLCTKCFHYRYTTWRYFSAAEAIYVHTNKPSQQGWKTVQKTSK